MAPRSTKTAPRSHLKETSKNMPKMSPNWSQRGSQNGTKIIKHDELFEAPCFKGGSQVASRPSPGSILERFWDHFGIIFFQFFQHMCGVFCLHSLAACCKQKRSKSQGVITRMQQRASKKQLFSSCHLALKSSLANFNELSGPC